jgi:peptidoglycan biosynthesis protein MviN/MurJ (putative lipid II flippase)
LVVDLVHPEVRAALHQFGGFVLVAATAQLASIYSKRMSTLTGWDTVALLGYANSIVEPLGAISGKVLAYQVGQPMAARLAKTDTLTQTRASLTSSLVAVAVMSAGLGLITIWLARPLIRILFGGGEFGESAIEQTAQFVQIMAIGLPPAIILWVVLYPLLGAGKQLAAFVYIAGHAAQVVTIWLLYEHFRGVALALSFPVGLWVQATLGWWFVTRNVPTDRTTQPLSGQ